MSSDKRRGTDWPEIWSTAAFKYKYTLSQADLNKWTWYKRKSNCACRQTLKGLSPLVPDHQIDASCPNSFPKLLKLNRFVPDSDRGVRV